MPETEIDELPPRLPETLAELDQARALLGERADLRKGELQPKAAARLIELVGELPPPPVAAAWKRALKLYREELEGELGTERMTELEQPEPEPKPPDVVDPAPLLRPAGGADLGDVIQLDPSKTRWGPVVCVVDQVKAWGVRAYWFAHNTGETGPTCMIATGAAYIRVPHEDYVVIGKAEWLFRVNDED